MDRHTHTQTKYRNPSAHARRGLITGGNQLVMNRLVVNRRIEIPGHVLYDGPTPDSDSKVVYNVHYRDNINAGMGSMYNIRVYT